jgi:hypothetical protein
MAEYEESRRQKGITMERVYEMATPMGAFVVAYVEADGGPAAMQAMATSDLPIDRDFRAALQDVHGVDFSQPAGPPPEVLADWRDPEVRERRAGLAFFAPVLPGRTDAGRAFSREAFATRRDEFTASRRPLRQNVEVVTLNSTPQGDLVCVYLEGVDPVEANRGFAASQSPYDLWFKDQLRTIFPPEIDFSQPVPSVQTLWDWHTAPVRA